MVPQISSHTLAATPPLADRRELLRRESLRDFAGVAVSVAVGALIWVTFQSLT